MTLWFLFALMTAAAIFAVLWPLGRAGGTKAAGSNLEVYRDQLDEIARDRAAGLIGQAEAEAAKVEVSRRLIAAADAVEAEKSIAVSPVWRRRLAALAGLILLPAGATALYLLLGSPELPGEPLAARNATTPNASIATLISQVEARLESNPNDVRGWEVLAPVYLRLGRGNDAVNARRKIIALAGDNAAREADLGEALVAAGNGVVTADAKAVFERAQSLDPQDLKSKFFIGLAAEQDGQKEKAGNTWRAMLEKAPTDAPWAPAVREALARVGGSAPPIAGTPGPSSSDIAAASGMSESERNEMIRGMVAQLAGRLKENGDDVEGWLRLVRAYMVLGDREKAQAAASDARRALAGKTDELGRIDALTKELGLEG